MPAPERFGSRDALLDDAASRARRYLRDLDAREVAPTPAALAELERLAGPFPSTGLDAAQVIALLDEIGSPATMATAGPRYFGFVVGGTLPVSLAASWLTTAWDQNAALATMSPVAARLDEVAIGWVATALGLPASTSGALVTGATMANASALAVARDATLSRAGWNAQRDGLVGAPPVSVWVGGEAHTTVNKALGIVGLGRGRAQVLPADRQGRIIPKNLPAIEGPAIVCLQAGNVNSGASDPFEPLIDWAHSFGAWVHVDGAFGLWGAASPALRGGLAGFQRADSWATDAHKWLNVGYDSGIVLVREAGHLAETMRTDAPYLVAGTEHTPMHHTPESSQRARGIEVWAALASLGADGLAAMIDGCCARARQLARGLADAGYAVLNDVVLNQVVVDLGSSTDAIIAAVQADGTCWAGPTTWQGRRAMRLSVSCWATGSEDIVRSIESIVSTGRRVGAAHAARR